MCPFRPRNCFVRSECRGLFPAASRVQFNLTDLHGLSIGLGYWFAPQGSWIIQSHQLGNQIQTLPLAMDPLHPSHDFGFILRTQLLTEPAQPFTNIWTTLEDCPPELFIIASVLGTERIMRIAD